MYADIRRYCSSCELCQRRHRPAPKRRAPLVTEVTSKPFRRIAIDITEMPVSARGNRYAIVIMDYFSKFVRVYPVQRQDAETVTTVLLDWVYDMGVPDKIHSDQGGQFESELSNRCASGWVSERPGRRPTILQAMVWWNVL